MRRRRKKSSVVAVILFLSAVLFVVVFFVMLWGFLFARRSEWSNVGLDPETGIRKDSELNSSTTWTEDEAYEKYIFGYFELDPELMQKDLDKMPSMTTPYYDDEGVLVKVWVDRFEEPGPLLPRYFISVYSKKNWTLRAAAQAACYVSWMFLWLVIAVILFILSLGMRWISRRPVKVRRRGQSSGRDVFGLFRAWLGRRRRGRPRGRGMSRR